MSSKLKVLQVIPKLGYGGAETGCYDLAHYLYEQNCASYIVTSGGELLKYVDKKKDGVVDMSELSLMAEKLDVKNFFCELISKLYESSRSLFIVPNINHLY